MKLKTVTIIKKEKSKNVPYMTHYTLIYRGRKYSEERSNFKPDRYVVGCTIPVEAYKSKGVD